MTDSVGMHFARAGMAAALYFLLTAALAPISFGFFQFRLSESLCVLPMIFPETALGLTLGCFLSNVFFSTPLDTLFGTIATALSSVLTFVAGRFIKRRKIAFFLGCLSPTVFNAILVPFAFVIQTFSWEAYYAAALEIAVCEAFSVYSFGGALYCFVTKYVKKYTLK